MNWRLRAACRGMDTELFFPDPSDREAIANALDVCAGCPVVDDCRTEAIERGEAFGVFGGMTAKQRGAFRRNPTGPEHGRMQTYRRHGCRCEQCKAAARHTWRRVKQAA